LKKRYISTLAPTIFSQIKQEVVMSALREKRIKLHEKRLKQKSDEVSKRVI
jgi:hypothetical protein